MVWDPPSRGTLKFNVDGATRGKLRPAGVGSMVCNEIEVVLALFSKNVGLMEPNEAKACTPS